MMMKTIFSIFLLLLGLALAENKDINFKKRGCAGRAVLIAKKSCKSECEKPTDACHDCILSKMPKRCKSLPSSDCYRCTKLHTETFPLCSNATDIPNCMGDILKPDETEPSCLYCICTLACPLYGPRSEICEQCRDENDNADYSEFCLHSHSEAKPLCEECWVASNDKCFKAFDVLPGTDDPVNFTKSIDSCGQSSSLAILNSDSKRAAAIEAVNKFARNQYWVAATCNSDGCQWMGPNGLGVVNHFNRRCRKLNSKQALRINKGGKYCNIPKDVDRGYVCEQDTCSICQKDNKICCPEDGECLNGYCTFSGSQEEKNFE